MLAINMLVSYSLDRPFFPKSKMPKLMPDAGDDIKNNLLVITKSMPVGCFTASNAVVAKDSTEVSLENAID